MPPRVHVVLTPHQRAALLTALTDYITSAKALEVSIDAASGEEIEIASLLVPLMDGRLEQGPNDEAEQLRTLDACLAAGWRLETDPEKIKARYRDLDLADTVPRPIIYTDIGVLLGKIAQLRRGWEEPIVPSDGGESIE